MLTDQIGTHSRCNAASGNGSHSASQYVQAATGKLVDGHGQKRIAQSDECKQANISASDGSLDYARTAQSFASHRNSL